MSFLITLMISLHLGWNLITGTSQYPDQFVADVKDQCDVSIIWGYDRSGWRGYVPEFHMYSDLYYMSKERGYWVYCEGN